MNFLIALVIVSTTPWFDDSVPPADDVLSLDDDEKISFGSGTDCWFEWDTGAATHNFRLVCTDVDGAGTDGAVYSIDTGTDDIVAVGDMTCVNLTSSGILSGTFAAGISDYDAFLVSDSGVIKFRTGAEILSDLTTELDGRYYTETELDAGQLDSIYYTETELDAGQLDNRYYTETELDAGQLDNQYYTETELDAGQLDNRYYTEAELDADQLTIYSLVDGTRAYTGDVLIDGAADEAQLVIQGAAAQTLANPLLLLENSAGTDMVAITSDGPDNIFIGVDAGDSNEAGGTNNIFIGQNAGTANTTGDQNIAIGVNAYDGASTALRNVAIGYGALGKVCSNHNVAIGYLALEDNTAAFQIGIGSQALMNNTSGLSNIGIGLSSLLTNTTGDYNVAIGYKALYYNNANNNVAIGWNSLENNTANSNVGIGLSSLRANTTGSGNLAIGNQALTANTEGLQNFGIGTGAGIAITTGDYNLGIGTSAIKSVTTASGNACIGYLCLEDNTASNNLCIGAYCMRQNTSGFGNVAIGANALENNKTGNTNTAIGYQAGMGVVGNSFGGNTLVGYDVGSSLTTGSSNVIIGYMMGDNLTTGGSNILIGYNIDASAVDATSELNIGDVIYGELDTGDIGIGVSTPITARLDVQDDAQSDFIANFFNDGNDANRYGIEVQCGADDGSGLTYYFDAEDGNGTNVGKLQNNAGTFELVDLSDRRFKRDINPTKLSGLDVISGIELVEFRFDSQGPSGKLHEIGFTAQNCETVFPEMVSESEDGEKMTSKAALIPVLTKAIQEQQAIIEQLETRIEALEIAK